MPSFDRQFADISIRKKLTATIAVTASSIFLICGFLAVTTVQHFRDSLANEITTLGNVIGANATAALTFQEAKTATDYLSTLRVQDNILVAALYLSDGSLLGKYERDAKYSSMLPPTLSEKGRGTTLHWTNEAVVLIEEIEVDGAVVGKVLLVSDVVDLNEKLNNFLWTSLLVVGAAMCIVLFFSTKLQHAISIPLVGLANTAQHVSEQGDFSVRAKASNNKDEIGKLVRGFNYMLDKIESTTNELKAAKTAAEKANNAKSEFVANTTHELRTPLSHIVGFAEILSDSVHGAEETRYLNLIRQSAHSLLGIINDILDISKIEAGRLELSPTNSDLGAHFQQVLRPFEMKAKKRDVNFIWEIDKTLPAQLWVDAMRLGQVITNLVNNAIKFTNVGGQVHVCIQVRDWDAKRLQLSVSVEDTGIGIPESAQKTIFEAFRQADASTTRQYGGTGLGLAISNRIVRMMGGEIAVKSEMEKGSTFSFTVSIPFAEENAIESPLPTTGEQKLSDSSAPALGAVQVLVVDDNALSREILVRHLKKAGVQVSVAESGKEAVELSQQAEFQLIFMDCQMPDMDGFQTTAEIRAQESKSGKRTPIVAFTAHAMQGYRDVCLQAGMDDYFTKPLPEKDLLGLVRRFAAKDA